MTDCCAVKGMNKFFSRGAGRYSRRYRKKGIDKASAILVRQVSALGVAEKSVLDVGCGVGGVHIALLHEGASTAQAIDVSEGMLQHAERLAREEGFGDRVRYLRGDIVEVNAKAEPADIVVLDKVICCYHEPAVLLQTVLARVKKAISVSYPRDSWMPRTMFGFMDWLGRLMKWSFHPYYHEPAMIDSLLRNGGLREAASGNTLIWQVKTFVRDDV